MVMTKKMRQFKNLMLISNRVKQMINHNNSSSGKIKGGTDSRMPPNQADIVVLNKLDLNSEQMVRSETDMEMEMGTGTAVTKTAETDTTLLHNKMTNNSSHKTTKS